MRLRKANEKQHIPFIHLYILAVLIKKMQLFGLYTGKSLSLLATFLIHSPKNSKSWQVEED